MGFEIGKTVAGYEIVEVLGTSKTGVAYKVRNVFAQRFEVLKILPKSIQDDEEQNARFLREIKVHAQLLHPNIVTFYNAREIEGQLVMTTEFVPGVILTEKLQAGPLAWREAGRYACHALSALQYAHGHGIIHRGFSSSNLIITAEGIARLNGFGFAKSVSDPELTAAGVVIGALKYMSPEQIKGEAIDLRCDIYSIGIVLYEMLAGKVPFDAKGQFEVMMAQVNAAPKPVSDVNPAVPRELSSLVDKALAKSPGDRFQTARDFRKAIERISLAQDTAPAESKASLTVAEVAKPAADPVPPVEIAQPVSQAPLPDTWALESALELAESKLATMELNPTQPVVETSAVVETLASRSWDFDLKPESAPKASSIETAQLTEAPTTVPPSPVEWWTSDAGVTTESNPATAVLEVALPIVEAAHIEAPAATVSANLPEPQAIESAIVSAESRPRTLKSELELPIHAFELPADTVKPVVEETPLDEVPARATDSALVSTGPSANTVKSDLELSPAAAFELPEEAAQPFIDTTPVYEAAVTTSSTSLPEPQAIESTITSVESTPAHTELIPEAESKTPVEAPAIPQAPAIDWWTLNSQLTASESDSSRAEFSLSPPELESPAPVAAALANAEPPVADKPSVPPDLWSTGWPSAPSDSQPEPAQLELLSAAGEPAKLLAEAPSIRENPEPSAPVVQPDLWAAETEPAASELTAASADLLSSTFAPESRGFFEKHAEPAEEPLSLWTSGPPDSWASEPAAPPPVEKSEPADLQSLAAALDPPTVPIEPAPQVEAPAVTPILAQEPQAIESQLQATEAPPELPSETPQAGAAAASVAAPVAQTPAQVNPDLLTALFGDTLLSRVSLTLVVCAITFFLGTVTLFAVLSVTKP